MTDSVCSIRGPSPLRDACFALLLVLTATVVPAQSPPPHAAPAGHSAPMGAPPRTNFDARYSHNHYYAPRGAYYPTVPGRAIPAGGRYWYSGGVWYAPRGPGYVVVQAPMGVYVPVLPPFYTTLWIGGFPYYYANETYYAWRADQLGYEVVAPPQNSMVTTEPPPSNELYIYPQHDQPPEQQATDKYECHTWAVAQTGFDPTQPDGDVPPDQQNAKRADYDRALRACLEGRGYSVR